MSISEVLVELKIVADDCYRVTSISKNEDIELQLKMLVKFCFIDNYFNQFNCRWVESLASTEINMFGFIKGRLMLMCQERSSQIGN